MGYEPTLSEKGRIAYDPTMALDESCYQDAKASDIFVLVVGGRYGSATSETNTEKTSHDFYSRYESVTQKEFESASEKGIPTYILVEKSVMSEFETFKKNRENESIEYAHVDSVNIFHFLDSILSKRRNNPTHQFEQPQEIEYWLKSQWSGYFKNLLEKKSQKEELSSLNRQVTELKTINTSLQRYLEKVIEAVSSDSAQEIIESEHKYLDEEKLNQKLMRLFFFDFLINEEGLDLNDIKKIFKTSKYISEIAESISELSHEITYFELFSSWQTEPDYLDEINQIRKLLGASPLTWDDEDAE